jgi:hypothetical protein
MAPSLKQNKKTSRSGALRKTGKTKAQSPLPNAHKGLADRKGYRMGEPKKFTIREVYVKSKNGPKIKLFQGQYAIYCIYYNIYAKYSIF